MSSSQFATQAPVALTPDLSHAPDTPDSATERRAAPLQIHRHDLEVKGNGPAGSRATVPPTSSIECAPLANRDSRCSTTVTSSSDDTGAPLSVADDGSGSLILRCIQQYREKARHGARHGAPMQFLYRYSKVPADQRAILDLDQAWWPFPSTKGNICRVVPESIRQQVVDRARRVAEERRTSAKEQSQPPVPPTKSTSSDADESNDEATDWSTSPPRSPIRRLPPSSPPERISIRNHGPNLDQDGPRSSTAQISRAVSNQKVGGSVRTQELQKGSDHLSTCTPLFPNPSETPAQAIISSTTRSLPKSAARQTHVLPKLAAIQVKNTPITSKLPQRQPLLSNGDLPFASTFVPATCLANPAMPVGLAAAHGPSSTASNEHHGLNNGVPLVDETTFSPKIHTSRAGRDISPPKLKRRKLNSNRVDDFADLGRRRGMERSRFKRGISKPQARSLEHGSEDEHTVNQASPSRSRSSEPRQAQLDARGRQVPFIHSVSSVVSAEQHPANPWSAAFDAYRAVYPEYVGSFKPFQVAVEQLCDLKRHGKSLHPFLWDDFVFRRADTYPEYQRRCADEAEDALLYPDYYQYHVKIPVATQGFITIEMLEDLERQNAVGKAVPQSRTATPVDHMEQYDTSTFRDTRLTLQGRESRGTSVRRDLPEVVVEDNLPLLDRAHISREIPPTLDPISTSSTPRRRSRLPWTTGEAISSSIEQSNGLLDPNRVAIPDLQVRSTPIVIDSPSPPRSGGDMATPEGQLPSSPSAEADVPRNQEQNTSNPKAPPRRMRSEVCDPTHGSTVFASFVAGYRSLQSERPALSDL